MADMLSPDCTLLRQGTMEVCCLMVLLVLIMSSIHILDFSTRSYFTNGYSGVLRQSLSNINDILQVVDMKLVLLNGLNCNLHGKSTDPLVVAHFCEKNVFHSIINSLNPSSASIMD